MLRVVHGSALESSGVLPRLEPFWSGAFALFHWASRPLRKHSRCAAETRCPWLRGAGTPRTRRSPRARTGSGTRSIRIRPAPPRGDHSLWGGPASPGDLAQQRARPGAERPALRRARAARVPRVRRSRQRLPPPPLRCMRAGPCCALLLQGTRILSFVQGPPHGGHGSAPRGSRVASSPRAPVGRQPVDAQSQQSFVRDFVVAWHKVMNLDRFELA